jgi:hypothetical protein
MVSRPDCRGSRSAASTLQGPVDASAQLDAPAARSMDLPIGVQLAGHEQSLEAGNSPHPCGTYGAGRPGKKLDSMALGH